MAQRSTLHGENGQGASLCRGRPAGDLALLLRGTFQEDRVRHSPYWRARVPNPEPVDGTFPEFRVWL